MPLQVTTRLFPAKSLRLAVFIAMMSTLTLSFLIFQQISLHLERKRFDPVFDRLDQLQMETSIRIFSTSGSVELQRYLQHLDDISGGAHHYLLDAKGIDLVTTQDHSAFLPPPPARRWRIRIDGHSVAAQRSVDDRYWFAAIGGKSRPWLWAYLPYYFLVAGATGVLCWLASAAVVSPIRTIALSMMRFGQGELSIRLKSKRQDEIGQLATAFDQMAEQLQRMIVSERRLLADVSHELRSPLARLKIAVRLARIAPDSDAALDRVDRDVDRMTSLIGDIVEVASAEGDFESRRLESVHLGDLLDEVIRDRAVEAEVHQCQIALIGRPDIQVFASRELLRRALDNVVGNAIRYAPPSSIVDVMSTADTSWVRVVVRDYGSGVPDDCLARIFDPFFRVDDARVANGGNSGLGLSIAKRAVSFHAGTIVATNASPGLSVEINIPRSSGLARLSVTSNT